LWADFVITYLEVFSTLKVRKGIPVNEIDYQIYIKIIAAGSWFSRGAKFYRALPGFERMSADGNKAMAEVGLAIADASRLFREKIKNETS
jgi:hypothetical protein